MATREDLSASSEARERRLDPVLRTSSGIVGDLRHWPIFFRLQPEFAKTVRLCCVFDVDEESGLESLIVTHDDKVWGLGKNAYGRLGNGTRVASWRPIEISVLSGKGIRSFAYGHAHVLALTGEGAVYGWGKNEYSQVGKPDPREIHIPTLVYNGNDPAEEIACGGVHSVCRTSTGAVYSWGRTNEGQTGSGRLSEQPVPVKVEGLIANLKCCGISCSWKSTVAVFENGDVYAWGFNGSGNLGIGSTRSSVLPVKVDFHSTSIRKVACGENHALALAVDGSLFVWGSNDFGQLGIEQEDIQWRPMRHSVLRTTYGRIVDIAASGCISTVITENSEVLAWGEYRGSTAVKAPTVVPFSSLQDVFASWSSTPETPVPLVVKSMTNPVAQRSSSSGWDGNLANTLAEHFDNPAFSDLQFRVGNETIHAHRTVLELQSEYFRTMFQHPQGPWKDVRNDTIEVPGTTYPVYRAFVRYFYTGEVDLPTTEALELLVLADSKGEPVLKAMCERLLRDTVSIDNCAGIYAAAVQYDSKNLEDFCWRFAVNNLTAVAQTQDFGNLPENILRKFITEAARKGAFRNCASSLSGSM